MRFHAWRLVVRACAAWAGLRLRPGVGEHVAGQMVRERARFRPGQLACLVATFRAWRTSAPRRSVARKSNTWRAM